MISSDERSIAELCAPPSAVVIRRLPVREFTWSQKWQNSEICRLLKAGYGAEDIAVRLCLKVEEVREYIDKLRRLGRLRHVCSASVALNQRALFVITGKKTGVFCDE